MPFCPNCRTEYVAGETTCKDCGAELVPALGRWQAGMQPAELSEFDDQVQLDLIEGQLRASGVPTARRPRRVALYVPHEQLELAQQIASGAAGSAREAVGLSELHRVRLTCASCEEVTVVDLLTSPLPSACKCGHFFELSDARSVLESYTSLVRSMADADFEIELEIPQD